METPVVTNKIELGHILQAGILVVTVGGAVLGGYLAIQGQVSIQGQSIVVLQQEQIQTIKWMQQIQDEQQTMKKDTNSALSNINEKLVELRIIMGTVRDGVVRK